MINYSLIGPYGSGKTIVCQKILEEAVKMLDKEKDILYYIIHDQYSLLQAECELFCKQLQDKYDIEIICQNHTQVGPRPKDNNFNFAKCLESLIESAAQDKNIHFFIDEFDLECLEEIHCSKISQFNKDSLKDSYFIIATQSVEKFRDIIPEFYPHGCVKIKNFIDILNETMSVIYLKKVMRLTSSILKGTSQLQSYIEDNPNCYELPNHIIKTTSPENPSDISLDRIFKRIPNSYFQDNKVSEKLKTRFLYSANSDCGHSIDGNLISMIRLPFNVDRAVLSNAIRMLSKPQFKRSLFICTDLDLAVNALISTEALDLKVITYLDGLTFDTIRSKKIEVYKNWVESKNSVLLTDNHGCRGLQNENVSHLIISKSIGPI